MIKSEPAYTPIQNNKNKSNQSQSWIIAILLALTAYLFYEKFLQSDLKWAENFDKFTQEKENNKNKNSPKTTTTIVPATEDPRLTLIREKLAEQGQLRAELEQKLKEKTEETEKMEKVLEDLKSQSEKLKLENTQIKNTKSTPRVQDLMYHHPDDENIRGRPFSGLENEKYLKIYNRYMESKEIELSKDKLIMPQALTAISENHFLEHNLTITTFFEHWPNGSKVMLWDLGLAADKVEYIKNNPDKYIYRRFDFSAYPPVVRWFPSHAFKIFCIMECLIEFGACMWMDSSISWTGDPKKLISHFTQR